jgi:hypothetical protein
MIVFTLHGRGSLAREETRRSQTTRLGAVSELGVAPVLTVSLGSNNSNVVSLSAHGW